MPSLQDAYHFSSICSSNNMDPSSTSLYMILLHYMLLLALYTTTCLSQPIKKTCQPMCGNLIVDYPFGIGTGCYLEGFQILCSNFTDPVPVLASLNLPINEIHRNGKIVLQKTGLMAFECQNSTGTRNNSAEVCLKVSPPFTISAQSNRFMAIGCDTSAYVTNNMFFNSSCETHWRRNQVSRGGLGHCQTALPEGATGFCYRVTTIRNYTNCTTSTRCSFAALVSAQTAFKSEPELLALTRPEGMATSQTFVADWAVETRDCPCGPNARCNVSLRGSGYLCECYDGFTGNPYLKEGGSCDSHQVPFPSAAVAIAAGFALVATFAAGSYTYNIYYPSPEGSAVLPPAGAPNAPRTPTLEDLQRIIKVCTWSHKLYDMLGRIREKGPLVEYKPLMVENTDQIEPFRSEFNFLRSWVRHPNVVRPYHCKLDEKTPDDAKLVYYKFYEHTLHHHLHSGNDDGGGGDGGGGDDETEKDHTMELAVTTSSWKDQLCLAVGTAEALVCCNGDDDGGGGDDETAKDHTMELAVATLSWKDRLRVAVGTARALACAHSQGIMHRDVRSRNILLDEKHNSKVIQFGVAMLLKPETYMKQSKGYLDPEYFKTTTLTYKSDVYAFGVLLVELLTSQDPSLDVDGPEEAYGLVTRFNLATDDEIDQSILKEVSMDESTREAKMEQLKKVVRVAEACLQERTEKRPNMSEVVVQLDCALKDCPDMDFNDNMYEELKKEAFDISMDLAVESEKTAEETGRAGLYELLTGSS